MTIIQTSQSVASSVFNFKTRAYLLAGLKCSLLGWGAEDGIDDKQYIV
jgi:hypothetical protein